MIKNKISKKAKSNKVIAMVMTVFMHVALVGGILYSAGVTTSSSASISKAETKSIAGAKSTTVKSKYYKAAKALKNRKP